MIATKLGVAALTAALLFVPIVSARAPGGADTLVLVVRHAEKAGPTGDVPLSAAGEARAQVLAGLAREAGVSAVITTQFLRTRQTAHPFVESSGVTPEVIPAGGAAAEHARAVAEFVRSRYAGRTVLIVGHSNTVPAIVAALGGPRLADICDEVYDDLFTVVIAGDGSARLVHGRYGAPTPPGAACSAMR